MTSPGPGCGPGATGAPGPSRLCGPRSVPWPSCLSRPVTRLIRLCRQFRV